MHSVLKVWLFQHEKATGDKFELQEDGLQNIQASYYQSE